MAQSVDLSRAPIQPFNPHIDSASVAQRWEKWVKSFGYYLTASGVQTDGQKRALLLHLSGPSVQELFDTLTETVPEDTQPSYATAMTALTSYFQPKRNIPFERHVFRQACQKDGESMDSFCTRLRTLISSCGYGEFAEEMIRDQIVEKCRDSRLRRRVLRESDLTLATLLNIARAAETADIQAQKIEATHCGDTSTPMKEEVDRISVKSGTRPKTKKPSSNTQYCFRCGSPKHIASGCTVAANKTCNICHKTGHFAIVCRSNPMAKNVQQVRKTDYESRKTMNFTNTIDTESSDDDDDDYVFTCSYAPTQVANHGLIQVTKSKCPDTPLNTQVEVNYVSKSSKVVASNDTLATSADIEVSIDGQNIQMLIDSGSSVNLLSQSVYLSKFSSHVLKKVNKKVHAYASNEPLPILGSIDGVVTVGNQSIHATFIIVPGSHKCLLGRKTSCALNVLKINVPEVNTVTENKDIFTGLGKLKDFQLHIHIDETVTPVAQPIRRLPFNVRKKVNKKIDELIEADVIEPATGPSTWVSPLVVVPKSNGDVRICLDMRRVNCAIIRERHPIPTLDEVVQDMNGASVFSKLDLNMGYHQIELAPDSRNITTFVTDRGIYRYKRLLFGLSSASECYQHCIQQVIAGCPGARNISDDILVFGSTREEHDERLRTVMSKLQTAGLTLNKEKCIFGAKEITFMGHVLSAKGMSPTESKVSAIQNTREPQNVSELRSFLGLVNYVARFIPDYSTITAPLRTLSKKNCKWSWNVPQQNAFELLKSKLSSASVMAYYDPEAKTQLIVDASPYALGAVLSQKSLTSDGYRPVAYASKSLTDTEQRYSQTEREALAVVWGCERFHLYLYGIEFDLITDHKPLEIIYSATSRPPARIERWSLRLQPYMFKVIYKPGSQNVADVLSRLQLEKRIVAQKRSIAETYVCFVANSAVPKSMSFDQIDLESSMDPEVIKLRRCVLQENWDLCPSVYLRFKHEFSVYGNTVLRGSRMVMPPSLRKNSMQLAHQGHMGIVKMKQRTRGKVWWPNVDRDIEEYISLCHACQTTGSETHPEPLKPTKMPRNPWEHIAIDLCGPLPTGETLIVVVDYHSRYVEVGITKSTTSDKIICYLKSVFATHGLPSILTSDNGSQFISEEFATFMNDCGIEHRRITPLWPSANGEVERFNRNIKLALKKAKVENKGWKEALVDYLFAYRNTPHSATGVAPSLLLFRRDVRNGIPSAPKMKGVKPTIRSQISKACKHDGVYKSKSKTYTDQKRHAIQSSVKVGDQVLVRQPRLNMLSTRYGPEPFTVIGRSGTQLILRSSANKILRRNSSKVRKFVGKAGQSHLHVTDDLDDNQVSMHDAQVPRVTQFQPIHCRPHRDHRPPHRFQDFIMN